MLSSFDASLLVAVTTPDAGTHVTKRPQQCWAVSLSAVNACLSTGRQHPPDHGWQGNKAIPGRATRPPDYRGYSQGNGEIVDTRPALRVELEEVSDDVLGAMCNWGLASYDAVHALSAIYAGAPAMVTLVTGFADVPREDLNVYVNATRVPDCRRRRGGAGR